MELAKRVDQIQDSVTMAFDKKAKDMKANYPRTIILAAGEPDFAPPQAAIDATCEAAKTGKKNEIHAGKRHSAIAQSDR